MLALILQYAKILHEQTHSHPDTRFGTLSLIATIDQRTGIGLVILAHFNRLVVLCNQDPM